MQISVLLSNTEIQLACHEFIEQHLSVDADIESSLVEFQSHKGTVSGSVTITLPTSSLENFRQQQCLLCRTQQEPVPSESTEESSETSSEQKQPPQELSEISPTTHQTEDTPITQEILPSQSASDVCSEIVSPSQCHVTTPSDTQEVQLIGESSAITENPPIKEHSAKKQQISLPHQEPTQECTPTEMLSPVPKFDENAMRKSPLFA